MSLLRLLTTGKSLVGLKQPDHRYHLPGESALPKFGGKKNPFRATVFPDKTETPAEIEAVESPALAEPASVRPPEAAPASVQSAVKAAPVAPDPAPERAAGRASPLRALLLWGRAKKANPARALTGRPLVQGELSLDRVKVVRNDLSETDFEIVPVGRGQGESTTISSSVGIARDGECVAVPSKM